MLQQPVRTKKNKKSKKRKITAVPRRAQPQENLVPFGNEANGALHMNRNFTVWSSWRNEALAKCESFQGIISRQ